MYVIIGLALVIIGWLIQLHRLAIRKRPGLSPYFLLVYALGAAVLTADGFINGTVTTAALNLVCAILPAVVLGLVIARAGSGGVPLDKTQKPDDTGRPAPTRRPGTPPDNPRVIVNPRYPNTRNDPRNPPKPDIYQN